MLTLCDTDFSLLNLGSFVEHGVECSFKFLYGLKKEFCFFLLVLVKFGQASSFCSHQ